MLKGTMYITDSVDLVYNTSINPLSKIVSLDEDGILDDYKGIIGGTCLLPPMEAKIAEADGNEQLYDSIYSNHLLLPFQQQFVAALIAFLYKGGSLLLFLPEIDYNNTTKKLVFHLFNLYGIHIGIIGDPNPTIANWYTAPSCIPIWLNLIYIADVISWEEYLYMYPVDAIISNDQVIMKLMDEMRPYGETINDMKNYIYHFHKVIHKNPNVKQAISHI